MVENKTQPTEADVPAFIDGVPDASRREDAKTLCALMERISGQPPVLWGPNIVGFGRYHYHYASGREGDSPLVSFSPRAKELVLYLFCYGDWSADLLTRLGKHRIGKSCLYIKSLADVDADVLIELVERSIGAIRSRYPQAA